MQDETFFGQRLINTPCGAKAIFDVESGCGYRCLDCFAIVGSVGCPCSSPATPPQESPDDRTE